MNVALVIVLIIASVEFSTSDEADECPTFCTFIYSPVCGNNGDCFAQFASLCEAKALTCKKTYTGPKLNFESGPCPEAVKKCDYDFYNQPSGLEANTEQPCLKEDKDCKQNVSNSSDTQGECALNCPHAYKPVCGYNGQCHITFNNECDMRMLNCINNYKGPKFDIKGDSQLCPKDAKECDFHYANYIYIFTKEQESLVKDSSENGFQPKVLHSSNDEDECPFVCPILYDQVCGYNGDCHIQFENECHLEMLNCNKNYTGPKFVANKQFKLCQNDDKKCDLSNNYFVELECPLFCPLDQNPVCGFNGDCYIQFKNLCEVKKLNCSPKYSGHKFSEHGISGQCDKAVKKCDFDYRSKI